MAEDEFRGGAVSSAGRVETLLVKNFFESSGAGRDANESKVPLDHNFGFNGLWQTIASMGAHGKFGHIRFTQVDGADAVRAGRTWWDSNALEYLEENGEFLGTDQFIWGPEGLTEEEAQLLGPTSDLAGQHILEVGSGAAQCSRWLSAQGARVVATDISEGMLKNSRELDRTLKAGAASTMGIPVVAADARKLPFGDGAFDSVFTSFGAIPFVADAELIHQEVARVLKPGGRWVFSVTHPVRWMFPDDPTTHGTTIIRSYFAQEPYVEFDSAGQVEYAEFHQTVGGHLRQVVAAGLTVLDLVEPEWPKTNTNVWGGWGPERGALLPGTMILVCQKP